MELVGILYPNLLLILFSGVVRDLHLSYLYHRSAADQDNINSQYCAGCMLLQGVGVEKNEKEAYRYLKLASKKGIVTSP
jgi:TPR repeat protein